MSWLPLLLEDLHVHAGLASNTLVPTQCAVVRGSFHKHVCIVSAVHRFDPSRRHCTLRFCVLSAQLYEHLHRARNQHYAQMADGLFLTQTDGRAAL